MTVSVGAGPCPGSRVVETSTPYSLLVLAESILDVVSSAGGLLFDRSLGGWQVIVGVTDEPYEQALRILGVKALPLETALRASGNHLAVSAEAVATDQRIQQKVRASTRTDRTSVAYWGSSAEAIEDERLQTRQYPLGAGARAFKAHAMAAITTESSPQSNFEIFRSRPQSALFG